MLREVRSKKLTMTEKIYQEQNQLNMSFDLIKQWDDETSKTGKYEPIIRDTLIR